MPPESWVTQNDALQELVLWVDPALLKQVSWERPVQDFDEAVITWLAEVLRQRGRPLLWVRPTGRIHQ